MNGKKGYPIQDIVKYKLEHQQGLVQEFFLIKWEGYHHNRNTWEPRAHIDHNFATVLLMNKAISQWYQESKQILGLQNSNSNAAEDIKKIKKSKEQQPEILKAKRERRIKSYITLAKQGLQNGIEKNKVIKKIQQKNQNSQSSEEQQNTQKIKKRKIIQKDLKPHEKIEYGKILNDGESIRIFRPRLTQERKKMLQRNSANLNFSRLNDQQKQLMENFTLYDIDNKEKLCALTMKDIVKKILHKLQNDQNSKFLVQLCDNRKCQVSKQHLKQFCPKLLLEFYENSQKKQNSNG